MAKINGVHSGGIIGDVINYHGASVPSFALLCDGSAVSRTTYAALFATIGVSAGAGNGTTTFNLPDLRGKFLRGIDGGAGNDPDSASRTAAASGGNAGDNVGSVQSHQFAQHQHNMTLTRYWGNQPAGNHGWGADDNPQFGAFTNVTDGPGPGGSETRPLNTYVNYCIVWK